MARRSTLFISIHAPARGATKRYVVVHVPNVISIHAPARGATPARCRSESQGADFNPRSRAGSDRAVRGLTHPLHYFNPRSRAGSDVFLPPALPRRNAFQSTLPRGERHPDVEALRVAMEFQSTLPRGERHGLVRNLDTGPFISIHAPARGATCSVAPLEGALGHFNPRSRAGSDSRAEPVRPARADFNPRSRAGSDGA